MYVPALFSNPFYQVTRGWNPSQSRWENILRSPCTSWKTAGRRRFKVGPCLNVRSNVSCSSPFRANCMLTYRSFVVSVIITMPRVIPASNTGSLSHFLCAKVNSADQKADELAEPARSPFTPAPLCRPWWNECAQRKRGPVRLTREIDRTLCYLINFVCVQDTITYNVHIEIYVMDFK